MATKISRSLFLLLGALGAACGQGPGPTSSSDGTTSSPDGPSAVLDEATSENARHAEVCRHAASLSDMLTDVTRHEFDMNALMARMAADSDQMRTDMDTHPCSEQGLNDMSQGVAATNAEVALHSTRMQMAETLGAGQYECSVHGHELRKILDSMRNDLRSMSCTP